MVNVYACYWVTFLRTKRVTLHFCFVLAYFIYISNFQACEATSGKKSRLER